MISNEDLTWIRGILMSDSVDDPENILMWFGENGIALIDEVLTARLAYDDLVAACQAQEKVDDLFYAWKQDPAGYREVKWYTALVEGRKLRRAAIARATETT